MLMQYEKVGERLTSGVPDNAGARDWCGAESWGVSLDDRLGARHVGS